MQYKKISYGEKLLRGFVKKCFPKYETLHNYRGAGIINPDTMQPLEIDIYIPGLKLGFEFNGRQHLTDESQRYRDKIKKQQCKKKGIVLITIWTATLTNSLFDKIKFHCDEHGIKIQKPTAKYLREFDILASEYKKNIYKINKTITSKKFVRRKK